MITVTFEPSGWEAFTTGQFVFPTCDSCGLETKALIRNSSRRFADVPEAVRREGVDVAVTVFDDGDRVFFDPVFGHVELGSTICVSKDTCPALAPRGSVDRIVVAECRLSADENAMFSQEHQIVYSNPQTGFFSSLLYDQRPVAPSGVTSSPIVVLAPKVWIGKHFTTRICFASVSTSIIPGLEQEPLEITVLSNDGRILASFLHYKRKNTAWYFDVGGSLPEHLSITDPPTFVTVVARGGAASYAIMTFVMNTRTGTFALEHSLPPPYYVDGDIKRIRLEAANFRGLRTSG